MIAGLLFAHRETDDAPARLTATLPFGGVTLIEYQARLLVEAGASQIVVLVSRLTPELLGAVARIGRRRVTVDAVRHLAEAQTKLHPLARVLMLADGLITTERVVASLAAEGGDAVLVLPQPEAGTRFERLGGQVAWAGVARLNPRRIEEAARLPLDYDPQSTLLRLADQVRAVHVLLPAEALAHGHGIEQDAAALAARGRTVLAAIVSDRRGWFDRLLLAPLARLALPPMIDRRWSGAAVGGAGAALGLAALATVGAASGAAGTVLALLGYMVLRLGETLSSLRDEPLSERAQRLGGLALAALTALFLGAAVSGQADTLTVLVIAVALVVVATLSERAGPERLRRTWWGSPGAYLLAVAAGALAGQAAVGLAAAGGYATATLAAAIERLRRQA